MNDNPQCDGASGWNQWSIYVLKELDRLGKSYDELRKDIVAGNKEIIERIDGLKSTVGALKVKVALIGSIAGLVASALVTAILRAVIK